MVPSLWLSHDFNFVTAPLPEVALSERVAPGGLFLLFFGPCAEVLWRLGCAEGWGCCGSKRHNTGQGMAPVVLRGTRARSNTLSPGKCPDLGSSVSAFRSSFRSCTSCGDPSCALSRRSLIPNEMQKALLLFFPH